MEKPVARQGFLKSNLRNKFFPYFQEQKKATGSSMDMKTLEEIVARVRLKVNTTVYFERKTQMDE
ncbi:hypothetical protein NECAME_00698 [Necator americanus]|uniref:Uncharacterized protein n=1 Tax=Necator americanus TaxID=51031 RepID=W2SXJ9_NECAM|nr:hypothetical protein NECAME_00698 [Necator americanus]ETN73611.1 hypothetical protein NECAME_00698 [Necator americanus]